MPARLARSSVSIAKPNNARKKSQKRSLEAFSIASHSAPEKLRIRQHRLGESVNDGPRQKRRRLEDDEEDDDDDEYASNSRRLQAKGVVKKTGGPNGGLDEEAEIESDSEGNEWTMGGPIEDEDDSELDSDEAFGESDEERFEGFTFRGSSSNKKGPKNRKKISAAPAREMDLNEDNGGQESDEEPDDFEDDEDAVDLATMLDDYDEEEEEEKAARAGREEEEDDDDTSETSVSEDEADDTDPTKLSKLQDLITSLESDPPEKRTGRTADAHESQQPSDYGLTSSQKLKISDLLPTVTDPALRKSLKLLSSDKASKRTGIPGKLDAPLPKRQQDRLDLIHNRRAEFLQFPLKDPNASEAVGTSKLIPAQQDKPANELESAIQNILEQSGLSTAKKGKADDDDEDEIMRAEELQLNKIPVEEVMARRAELRKARELLFREEVKAKRVKKIKSKSYRRVHRKEREREAAKWEGLDDDMNEDDKERQDRRRAEARMGTKHRDSKWAKSAKKAGRTVWDDDARDGVIEMARRNEELRRRIEGKDIRDDEDDEGTDIDEDEDEDEEEEDEILSDDEAERKRLQRQLGKLGADKDAKQSRLGAMAFMQRAEAARKAQNDEDIERMQRELAGEDSPSENEEEDASLGRAIFGPRPKSGPAPKAKPARAELEEGQASDEEAEEDVKIITDRPAAEVAPKQRQPRSILKKSNLPKESEEKPAAAGNDDWDWLPTASNKKKAAKQKGAKQSNGIITPATSSGTASETRDSSTEKEARSKSTSAPAHTDGWITVPYTNGSAPSRDPVTADASDAEDAEANPILSEKEKQAMYHARGFAGDDVQVDFEAEKTAQVADEDDKVTSTHLPGWGSWTGDGLSKAVRKANARAAHNPLHKRVDPGIKAANRRDAKLTNVIISEAQQRKGKKYLATQLPHQFKDEKGGKETYERSLRQPVGPEWSTKEVFQRNTRPRVVVKQGVIAPMERPLL
ncbi:hypothetical protein H2203_001412 [Taxawa tesnikishii (nom. ined.)]|nr:hypothetical protein H2203_001412 [Dothideales sp. JES 119]